MAQTQSILSPFCWKSVWWRHEEASGMTLLQPVMQQRRGGCVSIGNVSAEAALESGPLDATDSREWQEKQAWEVLMTQAWKWYPPLLLLMLSRISSVRLCATP